MRHPCWGLLLLLVGCADLAVVERLRCGNGLHERQANEDCDGLPADSPYRCAPPGTAAACRLICDEAPCPDGWRCGRDGVCRAGRGQFAPGVARAMAGFTLAMGDLDADGHDDVVTQTFASLAVAYGEPDGRLGQPLERAQPSAVTPPAVGDLDGDGFADVATFSGDGVHIFRGRAERRLVPVATPHATPTGVPIFAQAMRVTTGASAPRLVAAWRVGDAVRIEVDGRALDAGGPTPFPTVAVDRVLAAGAGAADRVDRLAYTTTDGQVHLAAIDCAATCTHRQLSSRPMPGGETVEAGRFGDLDGDGQIDLVLGWLEAGALRLAVVWGDGEAFGAVERLAVLDEAPMANNQPEQELIALEAVVDLVGDERAEIVSGRAIIRWDGGTGVERLRLSEMRPYLSVQVADIDGDGRPDLVGARETGIDLIRVNAAARLERRTISSQVDLLAVGDFDGDGRDEIAFYDASRAGLFLADNNDDATSTGLRFADQPEAPRVLAVTPGVGAAAFVEPATLHALRDGAWFALTGSAIEPPSTRLLDDGLGLGRDLTIGRFFAGAPGLIMRKQARFDGSQTWGLPGAVLGIDPPTPLRDPCAADSLQWAMTLALDDDGDGVDSLVTLTSGASGAAAGPSGMGPSGMGPGDMAPPGQAADWTIHRVDIEGDAAVCRWTGTVPRDLAPAELVAADLDGDGRLDLAALLTVREGAPTEPRQPGPARLAFWLANARSYGPTRLVDLPDGVVAAADARLVDGVRTLLLASADGLFTARWAADALVLTRLNALPATVKAIARGDVDGDGLDDVVVSTGETVLVQRQLACEARAAWAGLCQRRAP